MGGSRVVVTMVRTDSSVVVHLQSVFPRLTCRNEKVFYGTPPSSLCPPGARERHSNAFTLAAVSVTNGIILTHNPPTPTVNFCIFYSICWSCALNLDTRTSLCEFT